MASNTTDAAQAQVANAPAQHIGMPVWCSVLANLPCSCLAGARLLLARRGLSHALLSQLWVQSAIRNVNSSIHDILVFMCFTRKEHSVNSSLRLGDTLCMPQTSALCVFVCVFVCVCSMCALCVCSRTCSYVYVRLHERACVRARCTQACVYVCVHICMCMSMHTRVLVQV